MIKSELRKIYLERRRSLSAAEIEEKSRQIADRFFENFDLSKIKTLHCFIPIAKFNEIDTSLIYTKVWKDFPAVRIVAPRVNFGTGGTENLLFQTATDLVENQWGIREPKGRDAVKEAEIDMAIVPLLCFDRRGYRVGYGKGFYDRSLSKCRPDCAKIGLSYFSPETEIDDTGRYDVKLEHCITPERTFDFGTHKDAAKH